MKHNLFIRIIDDEHNYLKFKTAITKLEAGRIIEFIAANRKKHKAEEGEKKV